MDECLSDREMFGAKYFAERNETQLLHVLNVLVTMKRERERERQQLHAHFLAWFRSCCVTCVTLCAFMVYRQVSFYATDTLLYNIAQIGHKIPIYVCNSVYPGG